MRRTLCSVILGLSGGYLLSASRAVPGTDLVGWVGVHASTMADLRALPLVFLAVALLAFERGLPWIAWAATAVGFATHGALVGPRAGFPWLATVVAVFGAVVAARIGRDPAYAHRAPPEPEEGAHRLRLLEASGLIVAGGGAAVCIEAIARHVRLFGAGLAQDDVVTGSAFLLFGAFGAAAFGWLGATALLRRLAFPVALVLAAVATFVSLSFVDSIVDGIHLTSFTKRAGLTASDFAGLRWDAWIAAGAFVLPALAAGAALATARGRASVSCALFGAAAAVWIVPRVFDVGSERGIDTAELFAAQLVPIGALVAAAGAALAALAEERRKPVARYVSLLAIAGLALVPVLRTVKPIIVLAPWEGRAILPYLTYESPLGLVTVEPSRFDPSWKVARLDRRPVTPDRDEVDADVRRLRDSLELLPAARRAQRDLRVLFVGHVTPLRAETLLAEGVARIDRTSPSWRTQPRVETELFKGGPDGTTPMTLPPGDVLAPDEAETRVAAGDYDLVIAISVAGDAPARADVESPASTVIVRWLSLDEPLRGVENDVALAADAQGNAHFPAIVFGAAGLDHPSFGFVDSSVPGSGELRQFEFSEAEDVESPGENLGTLWALRADRARAAAVRALSVREGAPHPELRTALAAFYGSQVQSSPFETPGQRIETTDEMLSALEKATQAGPVDPFLHTAWEWLAGVLLEKREVGAIERYLVPLAREHGPWTWVEIALAQAEMEGLDPAAAARRLEPIVRRDVGNYAAWYRLGEALELTGDARGAAGAFRGASQIRPNLIDPRRRLALALARAGDPEGARIAEQIATMDSKDEEMRACAEGRPPPAPKSYQPSSGRH